MRNTSSLSLIALVFILTGCLEQPGASSTSIPNVDVECSSAQVFSPHCRNTGEILWIGLTRTYDLDCGTVLSGLSAAQRANTFEAYADGISLTKSGILVQATVTTWKRPGGGSAIGLSEGDYKICAFIEQAGGNDRLDMNEPIGSGLITVGGESPQVANDWISY